MYGSRQRVVRRVTPPSQRKRLLTVRRLILLGAACYVILVLHPKIPKLLGKADAEPKFTKAQTVCLDAGHGGSDTGAISGSLSERNLNLTVAKQVKNLLQAQGYRVWMTRTNNDDYLTNHDRYTYCNNRHATVLVSIHQNYFDDHTVDYTETLYYKDSDQRLAQALSNGVAARLRTSNNSIADFDDGVLSKSTMPAALVEALFMTDSGERHRLTSPGSQRLSNEAQGIAQGIVAYFTNPPQPKPQGVNLRPGD